MVSDIRRLLLTHVRDGYADGSAASVEGVVEVGDVAAQTRVVRELGAVGT